MHLRENTVTLRDDVQAKATVTSFWVNDIGQVRDYCVGYLCIF